jgi:hypothetical protein
VACRLLGLPLSFTIGNQVLANTTDICVISRGSPMVQVTARLPDALCAELDVAAQQLNRCRADIIRQPIEY